MCSYIPDGRHDDVRNRTFVEAERGSHDRTVVNLPHEISSLPARRVGDCGRM
jgi:hypothetical protein